MKNNIKNIIGSTLVAGTIALNSGCSALYIANNMASSSDKNNCIEVYTKNPEKGVINIENFCSKYTNEQSLTPKEFIGKEVPNQFKKAYNGTDENFVKSIDKFHKNKDFYINQMDEFSNLKTVSKNNKPSLEEKLLYASLFATNEALWMGMTETPWLKNIIAGTSADTNKFYLDVNQVKNSNPFLEKEDKVKLNNEYESNIDLHKNIAKLQAKKYMENWSTNVNKIMTDDKYSSSISTMIGSVGIAQAALSGWNPVSIAATFGLYSFFNGKEISDSFAKDVDTVANDLAYDCRTSNDKDKCSLGYFTKEMNERLFWRN